MITTPIYTMTDFLDLFSWGTLCFILIALVILVGAKLLNKALSRYRLDHELTEEDNAAVAVSFGGFLLALCIVLHGVLLAPSARQSLGADLLNTAIWSAGAVVLLIVARVINDRLILPRFRNHDQLVKGRNVGVGCAQAGGYIATALILKGLIMAELTYPSGQALLQTLLWFAAGQALFIVFALVYEKLFTSYCLHSELERNNVAAGVSFGGDLVALGIILSYYVRYYDNMLGLLLWAVIAMIFLRLVRVVIDKLILPRQPLDREISEDQNWGAGFIEACASIGLALLITGILA